MKFRVHQIIFVTLIYLIGSFVFPQQRDNIGIKFEAIGIAEKISDSNGSSSTITYYLRKKDNKLIQIHTPYEAPEIGEQYKIEGILYSDYQSGQPFVSEKSRQILIDNTNYIALEGNTNKDISEISKSLIKLHHDIDQYKKEFVEVTGTVVRHYREANWYQIKGKYGTTLDIQGYGDVPNVNSEITKCGVLYVNSAGDPFLSELPEIKIINTKVPIGQESSNNTLLYSFLGVLFVFGIGVAVTTYVKKIRNQEPDILMNAINEPVNYEEVDDTLILSTPTKTAKILPGRITIVSEAHDKGETFPISGTPVHDGFTATVGKSPNCDISIANREEYSTVSREHAMFIYKDNQMWIQNLSHTNPTIVNGMQLGEEVIPLKDGDRIKMGLLELLFETFA